MANMVSSVSMYAPRGEERTLSPGSDSSILQPREGLLQPHQGPFQPYLQLLIPRFWGLGSQGPVPGQDGGRGSMGSRVTQRDGCVKSQFHHHWLSNRAGSLIPLIPDKLFCKAETSPTPQRPSSTVSVVINREPLVV